jgi:hypothetical protein
MPSLELKFTGLDELQRNLSEIAREYPGETAQATWDKANHILNAAKLIVPHDLGALEDSGFVTPIQREGDSFVVKIGFGGPAAPYAMVQHEDLVWHARSRQLVPFAMEHDPPRRSKYLETPFIEAMPTFVRWVRDRAAQLLARHSK